MANIVVNGEREEIKDGTCVEAFLAQVRQDGRAGVVVALNGEILRREHYPQRTLKEGDSLELVQMTAGG